MIVFILGLLIVDNTIKKWKSKQKIIYSNGLYNPKIIFILLKKVIAVYIRFF